ncbi:MAG: hypothetical protein ACI4AH_04725 [Muribaculaceae bacterium]
MKKFRLLFAIAAITLCATANAQFTTGGNRSSVSNSQDETSVGYRGFIDAAFTIGTGDCGVDRVELATIHGYQFNPYFFAGVGVAGHYYLSDGLDNFALPVFADFRGEYNTGQVTPFFDFRIGYSIDVNEIKGIYVAPSVGVKVKQFNASIGYSSQKFDFGDYGSLTSGGFTIRVGFDF